MTGLGVDDDGNVHVSYDWKNITLNCVCKDKDDDPVCKMP